MLQYYFHDGAYTDDSRNQYMMTTCNEGGAFDLQVMFGSSYCLSHRKAMARSIRARTDRVSAINVAQLGPTRAHP